MINAISATIVSRVSSTNYAATDIAFIMSSSTSAWLLTPWSVLRNKMAECFTSVSEDELREKCIIKQLLNSVFCMIS